MSNDSLKLLSENLSDTKRVVNEVSGKLTLEEYDILYGYVEHCQYLILELQEKQNNE